ncbi:sigma-70 family RNA polymerase sigma factor [Micromonospora vinacea]|uniref:RNA polymerase sigma factor n=1 Tax=Micromonospora vinacea TaxID=709878 RepID=UPI00344E393A
MARADEGLPDPAAAPDAEEALTAVCDYDSFFDHAYPSLLRMALLAGATVEEAEDVLGDVMAYLVRHWGAVETPWAYSIQAVRNGVRKVRKREKERLERVARGGHVTPAGASDVALNEWEDQEWVIQHLTRLPLHQRAVMAYDYDGLRTDEIAAKLGKKPANVRKLLQLARERLRSELASERERDRRLSTSDDQAARKETR